MRFVMFYHSLESDWNHGNAHFLRGVVGELLARGHEVRVFEPKDGWSRTNLVRDYGNPAIERFRRAFPELRSEQYDAAAIDLDSVLEPADVVIVHEWSDHDLVARIGAHHAATPSYLLLFHDTHHRSVTDTPSMAAYDLSEYDGVLAFGDVIRDLYLERGWTRQAWTWHEAADVRVFYPRALHDPERLADVTCDVGRLGPWSGRSSPLGARTPHDEVSARSRQRNVFKRRDADYDGDVVWIGNWGDEERTAELDEFLLTPVKRLGLRAALYGVRYPEQARKRLAADGIEYRGWVPNHEVPEIFSRYKVTVHVPRRPYLDSLPGVPTIRPFEALACGIPLVSARWCETAGLFQSGLDFLVARDGEEMMRHLAELVSSADRRTVLARHGLATIRSRHTCAHRVDELLGIVAGCRGRSHETGAHARRTDSQVPRADTEVRPHEIQIPARDGGSSAYPFDASEAM